MCGFEKYLHCLVCKLADVPTKSRMPQLLHSQSYCRCCHLCSSCAVLVARCLPLSRVCLNNAYFHLLCATSPVYPKRCCVRVSPSVPHMRVLVNVRTSYVRMLSENPRCTTCLVQSSLIAGSCKPPLGLGYELSRKTCHGMLCF